MDDRIKKYLTAIRLAIIEIEVASETRDKTFDTFTSDVVFRRFIERNIEIIGEAMNRILRLNPDISITSAQDCRYPQLCDSLIRFSHP